MRKIYFFLLFVSGMSGFVLLANTINASASSASDFNPGYIIDDAVFTNKNSMNVQQIQEFLNTMVPSCDRNHAPYKGVTGTVYPPPWTCLKEYNENPTTHVNNLNLFNADGSPVLVAGGLTSAQIIYNASQEYNINPEVLLVNLQKETGLITDTWPTSYQYKTAMGYGCPDSGPNNSANCNSNYYGFYNQVMDTAWQFNQYMQNPNNYNFQGGASRYIQYNPNTNCGGSSVYIQNASTAALYDYTPYQPNSNTINYVLGNGSLDQCGSYGNINFFKL